MFRDKVYAPWVCVKNKEKTETIENKIDHFVCVCFYFFFLVGWNILNLSLAIERRLAVATVSIFTSFFSSLVYMLFYWILFGYGLWLCCYFPSGLQFSHSLMFENIRRILIAFISSFISMCMVRLCVCVCLMCGWYKGSLCATKSLILFFMYMSLVFIRSRCYTIYWKTIGLHLSLSQ